MPVAHLILHSLDLHPQAADLAVEITDIRLWGTQLIARLTSLRSNLGNLVSAENKEREWITCNYQLSDCGDAWVSLTGFSSSLSDKAFQNKGLNIIFDLELQQMISLFFTLLLYQLSASARLRAAMPSYCVLTSDTIRSMSRARELSICTTTDVPFRLSCSSRNSCWKIQKQSNN